MAGKTRTRDMTEGVIWKQIILFALPLMIGYVFQQFYNTVDCIVVGNFVGKEALAAVGATSSIINTMVGFFMGMATGAGGVISQYFGAKDELHVQKAVHTTLTLTLLLAVVCAFASPWALGTLVLLLPAVLLTLPVIAGARGPLLVPVLAGTGLFELAYGVLLGVGLAL